MLTQFIILALELSDMAIAYSSSDNAFEDMIHPFHFTPRPAS
jgi:hypothetical protein